MARAIPDWVITEDFDDVDLGVIATGKEGEVGLVERVAQRPRVDTRAIVEPLIAGAAAVGHQAFRRQQQGDAVEETAGLAPVEAAQQVASEAQQQRAVQQRDVKGSARGETAQRGVPHAALHHEPEGAAVARMMLVEAPLDDVAAEDGARARFESVVVGWAGKLFVGEEFLAGFVVDEVEDRLAGAAYPIVISDIYIDQHTGLDVLKAARGREPECAMILMTARGTMETVMEATRGGAFDYIAKPFEIDRLLDAVQRAEAAHAAAGDGAEHGDGAESRHGPEHGDGPESRDGHGGHPAAAGRAGHRRHGG